MTEHVSNGLEELAFALSCGETPTPEQARHLDRIRSNAAERQELADLVHLLKNIRVCVSPESNDDRKVDAVDDELIAAYLDGSLDAVERERAEKLLARSPEARHQLVALAAALRDVGDVGNESSAPWAFLIGIAREGLRVLVHPSEGFASLQMQPLAVLGPATIVQKKACEWTQEAGGVNVAFRILYADDDHVHLYLQVSTPAHGQAPAYTQVSVYQLDQLVESETLPDSGQLAFEGLSAGSYRLEIALPTQQSVSFSLDFRRIL